MNPERIKHRTLSCVLCISWFTLLQCGVPFCYAMSFDQQLENMQNDPHIGYIVPAGAQRGTTTTITVGGQYIEGADGIRISGGGVRGNVVGFDKPLSLNEALQVRNKLQKARAAKGIGSEERLGRREMQSLMEEAGVSREQLMKVLNRNRMRTDPTMQENEQVAEEVSIEIEVLPDAKPGRRELRIVRDGRLSAPLAFYIGETLERTEADKAAVEPTLPIVFNGQIMPGETDEWAFRASKGDQLVVAALARELVPHLADAVPGWFQAVISLCDSAGQEVAYADDYRFNPDPAFYYEIPADGTYTLKIRDSIYRGRQDFVYRITLGEIPFVTSIFPLGGKIGEKTIVKLEGKNLPITKISMGDEPRIETLKGTPLAHPIPFGSSSLPEVMESEPNNSTVDAALVELGCVVNGRIDAPSDRDVFAVQLEKGEQLLVEVTARRLNSPLDSVLMITDAAGQQLALNNDTEDRSEGRITHHADARLIFEAPQAGAYHVHLGDIQNGGGADFAYRLFVGSPEPDYALRVAPSSLNGVPGESVPLTVYALRKDGFDGEIEILMKNGIEGLRLDGARIPEGQDQIELTLTLPPDPLDVPLTLELEGRAKIRTKTVSRPAVPAEDMTQAFVYHHLVLSEELLLANIENGFPRRQAAWDTDPVKIRRGKSVTITCNAPLSLGRQQLNLLPRNLPAGVSIENVDVSRGVIEITLAIDASAQKGLEGNLLFDLIAERTMPARDGREARTLRIAAGSLPALPFEIR